ncbi:MAG: STAS domain-containing protein [Planctomycetaceae bacterium]|nr:STAS domain-containing protein [Planctomycetaceae bacterium]
MTASDTNYHIDQFGDYSAVTLLPAMNNAQWSEIEQAGTDIMGRLNGVKSPAVLVDLTPLNYMGSSMVAMIVRCWKNVQTNNGRIVVVCNNEVVREVISLAGLTKVWPIVENREDGLKELGVAAGGGGKTLSFVGIGAVLVAVVGAVLMVMGKVDPNVAKGLLFGGAGVGFVLGLVNLVKSTDSTRFWGLGVVLASAAIAVFGFVQR